MKATIFSIVALVASLTAAAPAMFNATATAAVKIDLNKAINIPPICLVCDGFGAGCVAACIAGGLFDPICDICAGPAIETCLTVSL